MKTTAQYPRLKTLDNRAPETMNMPHLMLRQKKVQKEEERYQEVRFLGAEKGVQGGKKRFVCSFRGRRGRRISVVMDSVRLFGVHAARG